MRELVAGPHPSPFLALEGIAGDGLTGGNEAPEVVAAAGWVGQLAHELAGPGGRGLLDLGPAAALGPVHGR